MVLYEAKLFIEVVRALDMKKRVLRGGDENIFGGRGNEGRYCNEISLLVCTELVTVCDTGQ